MANKEMGSLWTVQDRRVVSSDFTSKGSFWLLCLEKGRIGETTGIVEVRHNGGLDRVVVKARVKKKVGGEFWVFFDIEQDIFFFIKLDVR